MMLASRYFQILIEGICETPNNDKVSFKPVTVCASPPDTLHLYTMLKRFEINNANFDTPNTMLICTDQYIMFNKLPEFSTISQINTGGPFLAACVFNDVIACIAQGESPPATPFYLQLFHKNTGVFLRAVEFPSKILDVKCNNSFLFVCLEGTIEVYSIPQLNKIRTLDRKSSKGLMVCSDKYVIYPDDRKEGTIYILSLPDLTIVRFIHAHDNNITAIALSQDHTKVITASKKGTLIRVFSVETGEQIKEYRRGFTKGTIRGCAMSDDYLVAVSKHSVHVFNQKGKHASTTIPEPPVNCTILGTTVYVPLSNGSLCILIIDTNKFDLKIQSMSTIRRRV